MIPSGQVLPVPRLPSRPGGRSSSAVSTHAPGGAASASCPAAWSPGDCPDGAPFPVPWWHISDLSASETGCGEAAVCTGGPSAAAMELPRLEFVAIFWCFLFCVFLLVLFEFLSVVVTETLGSAVNASVVLMRTEIG